MQWQIADLIEKYRATVGSLKATEPVFTRVSKCAFLMTEQFRLEQRLADRPHIDCQKNIVGSHGLTM